MVTTLPMIRLQPSPKQSFGSLLLKGPTDVKLKMGTVPIGTALSSIGKGVLRGSGKALKFLRPKTLKGAVVGAVTLPTAALVVVQSPRAREALRFAFDPRKAPEKARIISGFIEDPKSILPTEEVGLKEKIKEAAKAAGIVGAGVAAAVGAVAVAKKVIKGKIPKLPFRKPSVKLPTGILPAPPSLTPSTAPLGAVQKPIEAQPIVPAAPSIKITNKPEINISFRKSRRFINQQILVK